MFKKILFAAAVSILGFSVCISAQSLDLQLKGVTVQEALTALGNAGGYSVILDSQDVDLQKKVDVSAESASVKDILAQIFAGQDIECSVNGKTISVSAASAKAAAAPRSISGVVVDGNGDPLIGASLMVMGTTKGFISDLDGKFVLEDLSFPCTLRVSYIGFSDKDLVLTGNEKSPMVITLAGSTVLDEVVVVGYGTQKRVNITGAVSVIDGKDLNNRPVTNAAAAIQGADPSLLLTMSSGAIESKNYNVTVRGTASISSSPSALIIVDGVESSLTQVNPNDIESISVLKDASACAIYGAKASAGVVLITTRSGEAGKTQVSYNGRVSVSQNTTSTDYITTAYDYVTLTNKFYTYLKGKGAWTYTPEQIQMMYERRNDLTENPERPWIVPDVTGTNTYVYLGNFDWYDFLFKRNRPETEHNITVTGGNNNVKYYVSGRYLYREGLFNNYAEDIYNGVSFRAKVDAKVTRWLDYSANLSYEYTDYNYGGYWEMDGSEGLNGTGILFNLTQNVGPMTVPYNPDGTLNAYSGYMADATSPLFSGRFGPYLTDGYHNRRTNNYLTLTNRLTFHIFKDLKLVADYTYRRRDKLGSYRSIPTANSYDNVNKRLYEGNGYTGGIFTNGSVYDFYNENRYFLSGHVLNAYFAYNHSFRGGHNLAATLGANFDDYRSSSLTIQQRGSLSENLSFINMAQGEIEKASESNTSYRTLGFFARVNYDYKGRYLAEISGRYDGTSRFAQGQRWGFFPSASIGWRISEEPFFESAKAYVNNFKIRYSYGSLGNQQVSNYYYLDTISTSGMSYTFDGVNQAFKATASDPKSSSLTWETVVTNNIGLDMSFLRSRLTFSGDFYIRDTRNMLTAAMTLPESYGATEPKENAADLRTIGYELSLGWRDHRMVAGSELSYGVSASLGDYKTVITRFENESKLLSSHYVGETLGEIWGYTTDGLFKTDEEAAAYMAEINDKNVSKGIYGGAAPNNVLMAGDLKYKDLNGDKAINSGDNTLDNPGDRRVIGNSLPRYTYSIKGDLSWYGVDLSIFFQGVGKIDWMPSANCIYFWGPYSYQRPTFIDKQFESRCWSEEEGADNSKAYFPRQRGRICNSGNIVTNDYFLQDASYIRLKNLTLGYTLPLKTKAVQKVRFYFNGENLWYWSPMKKNCRTVDPEVATSSTYGDCLYPYSRTFSFGVDLTF